MQTGSDLLNMNSNNAGIYTKSQSTDIKIKLIVRTITVKPFVFKSGVPHPDGQSVNRMM